MGGQIALAQVDARTRRQGSLNEPFNTCWEATQRRSMATVELPQSLIERSWDPLPIWGDGNSRPRFGSAWDLPSHRGWKLHVKRKRMR